MREHVLDSSNESPVSAHIRWVGAIGAATGLLCSAWFVSLLIAASLSALVPDLVLAALAASFAAVGAFGAARVAAALGTNPVAVAGAAVAAIVALGTFPPIAGPVVPFLSLRWLIGTVAGLAFGATHRQFRTVVGRASASWRRFAMVGVIAVAVLVDSTVPAGAWIASARLKRPTATMRRTGGTDLVIDTHQWFANRAVEILKGDGHTDVVAFLDSADPTAPEVPSKPGTNQTYRWRLLMGASDADGSLYKQVPDHFFNWWTHAGRQWIGGSSAGSNAETAYQNAVDAWRADDRGTAIRWLGASIHLLTDSCVPQHQFFSVNVYHHQFEAWVQKHQKGLAVKAGAIYQTDFRIDSGHGGSDWTSAYPRGWVDECAHRAARQLQSATHSNPKLSKPTDLQWSTSTLIADGQRFSAGYLAMFFADVKGP